jgi:hypothetical protein
MFGKVHNSDCGIDGTGSVTSRKAVKSERCRITRIKSASTTCAPIDLAQEPSIVFHVALPVMLFFESQNFPNFTI